jgi:hypothetical protein
MYLISNTDRDYIIKYLGMMIAHTPQNGLRAVNAVRLAKQLVSKLEAKQPLPAEATEALKNLPR